MPTPQSLREQSRRYREAARVEDDRDLKLTLASHALMLAQMAEKLERNGPGTGDDEKLAS